MWRYQPQPVEAGQRFRKAGVNRFRQPFPEWEVVEVTRDTNGLMAAELRSVTDETTRKTVAVAALVDRTFYEACR